MSGFYVEMAALADELLREFGGPAMLARVTPGGYDPATGSTTAPTTQTWDGVGAKFDYEQRDIDGTLVRQGDQRVYLSVVGMASPQTGDKLTVDGVQLSVVASRPLRPASVSVLHDVQVRGVL